VFSRVFNVVLSFNKSISFLIFLFSSSMASYLDFNSNSDGEGEGEGDGDGVDIIYILKISFGF
jgi:hypothetical protein